MIVNKEKNIELKFGTGDICINGGSVQKNNERIGVVAFSNQSPREIGSIGDKRADQPYSLDDFPVIMTFTKTESIDVLIEQLNQAKSDMVFYCGTRKNESR